MSQNVRHSPEMTTTKITTASYPCGNASQVIITKTSPSYPCGNARGVITTIYNNGVLPMRERFASDNLENSKSVLPRREREQQ